VTATASSRRALIFVTALFFAWGFTTSFIDPLVAAVRRVFDLSFGEAFLTTFAWFIAYGVVSLPSASVLARLGFARALLAALGVIVAGALLVPIATTLDWYPGVLFALFVIASGVTLLQVAANPLIAALGVKEKASARLNFAQGFNSLGTTIAPLLGARQLLTGGVFAGENGDRAASLRSIGLAFAAVGAGFVVIAALIFSARTAISESAPAHEEAVSPLRALRSKWAVAGAVAIFLYVGCEVTIGSTLTSFLAAVLDVTPAAAGAMVAYYWGGAMVGRFIGGALMLRVSVSKLLLGFAFAAAALAAIVTQSSGHLAAYAAIAIGLFNSIMFPSIFTLTLERSTAPTSATSGLIVFGIIEGAFLPQLAGVIADHTTTLQNVFFVPLAGYLLLVCFAFVTSRVAQP
jgi:FHS family L-fucose permease-like MFS transporter